MRVLARSVQNRLSIGIPLAVAIAVATVSLRVAGMSASLDFSSAPIAVLAVQLLFVSALAIGFRHSVRVPADLRARWLFHLIRPANHVAYMAGVKTGRGRQAGASRAAGITAVTRSRIRPTNGDPALHIRLAQRARARRGVPAGVSPTALCIQLRSGGERSRLTVASTHSSSWLACTRWPGWSTWR